MKKKIRKIVLILVMIIMTFSLGACGNRPMTTKEMLNIQDKYERGKISDEKYYEALDAYNSGEPAPKKGIAKLFSNVFGFIGEVIGLIIGFAIIAFIIGIFRKKK